MKLRVAKETIRILTGEDLTRMHGGVDWQYWLKPILKPFAGPDYGPYSPNLPGNGGPPVISAGL